MAGVNYTAVLADLQKKKEDLESAIATITLLLAGGSSGSGGDVAGGVFEPENIPVGSFLRLTIVDAVKKLLDMTKSKLNIPQIARALERGGLPPAKPNTIYAVLRRRENEVGDLIRFGDEWALSEWYPNNPHLRKQRVAKSGKAKKNTGKVAKVKTKAPIVKKPVTTNPGATAPTTAPGPPPMKTADAAAQILEHEPNGLDPNTLADRVNSMLGKKLNANLLKGILAKDKEQRFVGSDDLWILQK